MNLFIDLVETGKVRSQGELRSLYTHFVKKYHPDTRLAGDKNIDFDELKRDYRAATLRLGAMLAEGRSAAPEGAGRGPGRGPGPFRYDAAAFVGELRDLVARGLPVSERAVRKNKGYARSIELVSACLAHLYAGSYGFAAMNDHVEFLRSRLPRVYWYVLQVLWSCFDCASGYAYGAIIAKRHLRCISYLLEEMGFQALDTFLGDFIEISRKEGGRVRLARRGSP